MEKKKKTVSRVIPSDIIVYDILTRVPTESLVRFRCVCKNWSNLFFHDSLFVNLHSQRNTNSTSSGLIEVNEDRRLIFIDHNEKRKKVLPITVGSGKVVVEDSLNGLLILRCDTRQDFYNTYYIYNTITNHSFVIPEPIKSNYHNYYDFRLCYDPIHKKYKVVQVCRSDPTIVKIRILTLEHRSGDNSYGDDYSWRDIAVPTPERTESYYDFWHIYLNGFLYWIIETWALIPTNTGSLRFELGPIKPYILGLDTNRETFFQIKLPDQVSTSACDFRNLNEMKGSLCLSEYRDTHGEKELRIWTLKKKNHGDEEEWLETFKINMRNSIGNFDMKLFNMIKILAVLTVPKLKVIIVNTSPSIKSTYLSYDVESKQFEIIYAPTKSHARTYIHWHVNSIPNW